MTRSGPISPRAQAPGSSAYKEYASGPYALRACRSGPRSRHPPPAPPDAWGPPRFARGGITFNPAPPPLRFRALHLHYVGEDHRAAVHALVEELLQRPAYRG